MATYPDGPRRYAESEICSPVLMLHIPERMAPVARQQHGGAGLSVFSSYDIGPWPVDDRGRPLGSVDARLIIQDYMTTLIEGQAYTISVQRKEDRIALYLAPLGTVTPAELDSVRRRPAD